MPTLITVVRILVVNYDLSRKSYVKRNKKYVWFYLSKKKSVQNFSSKIVGTKIYIWLSTAFVVCYKIKHGGFDFHVHSSFEFSRLSPQRHYITPHSASVKKHNNKKIPTYPTYSWGHVTETRQFFVWPNTCSCTF